MDTVFTCNNLSKRYKETIALNGVSLQLQKGKIYGLVGNNGAGKSTLMKIMLELVYPTDGTFILLGEDSSSSKLKDVRKRIGSIIEQPVFDDRSTAYENMEDTRLLLGVDNKERSMEMLKLLGLEGKEKVKVSKFSLGMKQRLGLAMALLGEPEFLVLDEPVNGLDPSGIRELRELLVDLNREKGTTMLISSHYLEQLHHLATDFIILDQGKVIRKISHEELDRICKKQIFLSTSDNETAAEKLQKQLTDSIVTLGEGSIIIENYTGNIQRILGLLAAEKIAVLDIQERGMSFEEYFVELTKKERMFQHDG